MDWNTASRDDRVRFIKEQSAAGLSASQACALVGATRGAILGMARRHNIRFSGHALPGPRTAQRPPSPPKPPAIKVPQNSKAKMGTLKNGVCHFPLYNHPRERKDPINLPYCGHAVLEPGTDRINQYCPFHSKVMFRKPESSLL